MDLQSSKWTAEFPRHWWWHLLLVVGLGVLIYANTFHVPFYLDDKQQILNNPSIRNLGWFLHDLLPSSHGGDWGLKVRTVGYFTFALNYAVNGYHVFGYHLVNLVIHVSNALLVYALVVLLFRTPALQDSLLSDHTGGLALVCALLFTCHPIETQAVTYIVQRLASLATFFVLLTLVGYLKARLAFDSDRFNFKVLLWYLLGFLSSLLAMKTKEIAWTLPIIAVLVELLFFKARVRNRLLFLAPLLLTMVIIPLEALSFHPLASTAGQVAAATRVDSHLSRLDYLFTQFRVILTYLQLLVLPVHQNLDYDYPVFHSFFNAGVFFSFAVLLALFAVALVPLIGKKVTDGAVRLVSFGIFWFFITLSVTSSLIPIKDVIFEHRLYLPSIGLFLVIVTAAALLLKRFLRPERFGKIFPAVFFLIVVLLASATVARNAVWCSPFTLWGDVIAKSPKKARGYNNLGLAYAETHHYHQAITYYSTATDLDPTLSDAHSNLGIAYDKLGQPLKALAEYAKAIQTAPNNPTPLFNTGIIYASRKETDKAIAYYRRTLELRPTWAQVHFNLGMCYLSKGWNGKAVRQFAETLRFDPGMVQARMFLEYAQQHQ